MKQLFLAIVLIAVPVAMFSGYEIYAKSTSILSDSSLGDLSTFKSIVADVQTLVDKGDLAGARTRITDWETAWDAAETAIRPLNQAQWGNIDGASDAALSAVRSKKADQASAKSAVDALMAELDDPNIAP